MPCRPPCRHAGRSTRFQDFGNHVALYCTCCTNWLFSASSSHIRRLRQIKRVVALERQILLIALPLTRAACYRSVKLGHEHLSLEQVPKRETFSGIHTTRNFCNLLCRLFKYDPSAVQQSQTNPSNRPFEFPLRHTASAEHQSSQQQSW